MLCITVIAEALKHLSSNHPAREQERFQQSKQQRPPLLLCRIDMAFLLLKLENSDCSLFRVDRLEVLTAVSFSKTPQSV